MDASDAVIASLIEETIQWLTAAPYRMRRLRLRSDDRNVYVQYGNEGIQIDVVWERYSGSVECDITMPELKSQRDYRSVHFLADFFSQMTPAEQQIVKRAHGLERNESTISEICSLLRKYAGPVLEGSRDAYLEAMKPKPSRGWL